MKRSPSSRVPPAIILGSLGLALLASCSSEDGFPGGFDLPTAETLGGPVLTQPRVQPIYFSGFPYATAMDDFLTQLAGSTYWLAIATEYGVGPLKILPGYPTAVPVPSPTEATAVPDLMKQVAEEGRAVLGPPRGDTIYALFLDPATVLNEGGLTFCTNGGPSAYHDEWTIGGVPVPAVVVPTCMRYPGDTAGQTIGVDVLTPAVSHELIEAATNPLVHSDPAYGGIDPDHLLWAIVMNGAEVADLCENEKPNLIVPSDIGRPVQRIWSNRSARAGLGPCVPVPAGETYFNAVAAMHQRADYTLPTGSAYSVPTMLAGIGAAASADLIFRGGGNAPTNLAAVVLELDDETSLATEKPRPAMGLRGHALSVPIATSLATANGVLPLLVGAMDAERTALHFWVGGINRK